MKSGSESVIEARAVTKHFGGLTALDGISLCVRADDVIGLIGPNGAGKSTLFDILAGSAAPDQGQVHWFGERSLNPTPRKASFSGIARTFQLVELFDSMTVRENVALGGLSRARSMREALGKADPILEWTGLDAYAQLLPSQLSFGRRRRVELARALAARPRVLLADEVMAGVSPSEIGEISSVLATASEHGVAIVVVEHNLEFVMNFCKSIVVLNRGRIIAAGSPEDIANNDLVVETYIGRSKRRNTL
jgi:branched-chain amino acid transport system ATP-binding protein